VEVLKPQGFKAEIKVKSLADSPERFSDLNYIFLEDKSGEFYPVKIQKRRYMKDWPILLLEGIGDANLAEGLRGKTLWIPREMAKPLKKDSYYISDILGCTVKSNEGKEFGKVTEVLTTGSNDVYVCQKEGEKNDFLLPALKKVILNVDIQARLIVIDLAELQGLELNAD